MNDRASLRGVQHPVHDLEAATDFYRRSLALPVRFTDPGRYVSLDADGASLALVHPEENLGVRRPVAIFRVMDLEARVESSRAAGATVDRIAVGPHERRTVVHDPWGNQLILFAPL